MALMIPSFVMAKIPQPQNFQQQQQEQEKQFLGTFRITFYCNCSICCGSYSGGPTASGTMPQPGRTCACGDNISFGTQLYIDGLGTYTCEDRGVGNECIDIFVDSHEEALNLGVQYLDVYQLK